MVVVAMVNGAFRHVWRAEAEERRRMVLKAAGGPRAVAGGKGPAGICRASMDSGEAPLWRPRMASAPGVFALLIPEQPAGQNAAISAAAVGQSEVLLSRSCPAVCPAEKQEIGRLQRLLSPKLSHVPSRPARRCPAVPPPCRRDSGTLWRDFLFTGEQQAGGPPLVDEPLNPALRDVQFFGDLADGKAVLFGLNHPL